MVTSYAEHPSHLERLVVVIKMCAVPLFIGLQQKFPLTLFAASGAAFPHSIQLYNRSLNTDLSKIPLL